MVASSCECGIGHGNKVQSGVVQGTVTVRKPWLVALTMGLLAWAPATARAQGMPSQPFVVAGVGAQRPQTSNLQSSVDIPFRLETEQFRADNRAGDGRLVDVGGGAFLTRTLGFSVGITRFSSETAGSLTALVPQPLRFGMPAVDVAMTPLVHTETAVHLDAVFRPALAWTSRFTVMAFGGFSHVTARQQIQTDLDYDEVINVAALMSMITITRVALEDASSSANGFNAGGRVAWFPTASRRIGVAATYRYVKASASVKDGLQSTFTGTLVRKPYRSGRVPAERRRLRGVRPVILVAGAGIGGLAAAVALRRAGHEVAVFERASELTEVGAGLSLWLNALRALDALDLGPAVRARAVPAAGAALRTWDGRILVAADASEIQRRFGEFCVVVHRAALQSTLRDAVGPERLHTGYACIGFEEAGSEVIVRFKNGRDERGTLLVGADGLHSAVRAQLHGPQPARYAGYTAWRAVVPFEHSLLQPGETWGRGARFGQIPMAGSLVYWFATMNAPEGARASAGEKRELQRLFRGWHAPIEALIDATPEDHVLRNDIYDRAPIRDWGTGRVTLAGDAAHPMTPNLGQGGCQALEDAVVLGRMIVEQGPTPAALRAYEVSRRARTASIVRASRRVGAIGQWSSPLAVALRSLLMKHVAGRLQVRQMERVIAPGDQL